MEVAKISITTKRAIERKLEKSVDLENAERRLWFGVIVHAVRDLADNGRLIRRHAWRFLMGLDGGLAKAASLAGIDDEYVTRVVRQVVLHELREAA